MGRMRNPVGGELGALEREQTRNAGAPPTKKPRHAKDGACRQRVRREKRTRCT